jgi:hypothetical protein
LFATPVLAEELSRSENVVLGVVAGVITSFGLAIASLFATRVIAPWYHAFTYAGVDINGKWVAGIQEYGADYNYGFTLQQRGHELSGTATITRSGAGVVGYTDTFTIRGFTWEGYVSLTLRSVDRRRLSFATALLKVEDRGGQLTGQWVYRSGRTDRVEAEQLVLQRAPF